MRVVLDTNQFVSALIRKEGPPAQILQMWRHGTIEVAISQSLIDEVAEVLHRPHIRGTYHLTNEGIASFLRLLREYALIVPGEVAVNAIPEDPDDNMVLACAVEAEAAYIVSGDRHLLNLGTYHGIPVLRAVEFLLLVAAQTPPTETP